MLRNLINLYKKWRFRLQRKGAAWAETAQMHASSAVYVTWLDYENVRRYKFFNTHKAAQDFQNLLVSYSTYYGADPRTFKNTELGYTASEFRE